MPVVSFTAFRPTPRYDGNAWEAARIEEAEDSAGPWTELEIQALDPVDADPTVPAVRNFTTTLATLDDGWYRISFLDALDNIDVGDPINRVGDGYPETSELVAASNVEMLTTLSAADQDVLRLAARYAIEEYCGQTFDYEPDVTKTASGSGHYHLYLPKRLVNLTAIEVDDGGLTLSDIRVNSSLAQLEVIREASYASYYERTMMEVQGNPMMKFRYGDNNILITGDWGWETFPDDIRTAMRIDMEDQALADTNALSQTLRAFRKLGLRDISQGGLMASIGAGQGLSDKVVALLQPYIWQGRVGVSV